MSEYHEFRAIERPLTNKQVGELRRYSSRADITATSFSVEYNWGHFKGDPHQWMEKYFDAFVHVANWAPAGLWFRIPAHVLACEVGSVQWSSQAGRTHLSYFGVFPTVISNESRQ